MGGGVCENGVEGSTVGLLIVSGLGLEWLWRTWDKDQICAWALFVLLPCLGTVFLAVDSLGCLLVMVSC